MPERYVGETLGKYRIEAVVGTGGFAWVYRAFDPDLEIPVALKVLKPQYAGDETFEARFRREASTAAKLRHPNIVKIFAVGKERGAVYFAMDYLPNGLADRLDVMTVLPEDMLIRLGIDVARGLGYAHREGVIHRDIKTDNVLFDEHGNAVVADFGIARAVVGHMKQTGTNMVVGTPQYFAPEQARGQTLDGRADIYALGVTLYRAATGVLPFNGDDWYEIARQHVETRPEKPRALNAGLSRELQAVILKCLEKEPADRFATGEEMVEALEAIQYERGPATGIRTQIMPQLEPGSGPTSPIPRRRVLPARWQNATAITLAFGGIAAAAIGLASRRSTPVRAPIVVDTSAGSPADSVAATVGALTAAATRKLTVTAPAAATIFLNDSPVGKGPSWESDSLRAADYTVAARLASDVAPCPSASVAKQVSLTAAEPMTVPLVPRSCVRFSFDVLPSDNEAKYQLTPVGFAGETLRGSVRDPRVVPEGVYRIQVSRPGCTPYDNRDGERISRSSPKKRVRLFCAKS